MFFVARRRISVLGSMPVTLKPSSRRRAIWAPTPHPMSRHVAPGGSSDTQRAHARLMRWRPYRKGESKMLSPRYSAKNPFAVASWISMALRRDHFSSEFMSTEDHLPFAYCCINSRSEFDNPSQVCLAHTHSRLAQQLSRLDVRGIGGLHGASQAARYGGKIEN